MKTERHKIIDTICAHWFDYLTAIFFHDSLCGQRVRNFALSSAKDSE